MDKQNQDRLNYLFAAANKINQAIERTSPADRACNLMIFSLAIWSGINCITVPSANAASNHTDLVKNSQKSAVANQIVQTPKINSQISVLKLINLKQLISRSQLSFNYLSTSNSSKLNQADTNASVSSLKLPNRKNTASNQNNSVSSNSGFEPQILTNYPQVNQSGSLKLTQSSLAADWQAATNLNPTDSQQLDIKELSKSESVPPISNSEQSLQNSVSFESKLKQSNLKGATKSKVLGVAPISIENYNPNLNPINETLLEPQLPPLLDPEQYLPGNPTEFNGFIWPAEGAFTSGYGMRWGRMHKGIDIAGPVGTPIYAAAAGEVVYATWNSGGYGNLVKIKHSNDTITLYAHNSKLMVSKGQFVEQGQQIAAMGSTGRSTGSHLHFEIIQGTNAINPISLLPKK